MAVIFCMLGDRTFQRRDFKLFLLNHPATTTARFGHYAFADAGGIHCPTFLAIKPHSLLCGLTT